MSKPDLTLNEPAATGWLRAEFYGDTDAAQGYLFEARRQLGALRIRHGVNDRLANGEPGGFFRDFRTLPDGTQIETITNDGHDLVRITAQPTPAAPLPETAFTPPEAVTAEGEATAYEDTPAFPDQLPETEVTEPRRVQLDDYAVCGYSEDGNYGVYLFHWAPDGGFTDIPMVGDCYFGRTARLSLDGEVVCGYMSDDNADQAFYWTRAGGSRLLPAADNSYATGVSADGTVFCGWGQAIYGTGLISPRAYLWTLGVGGVPAAADLPLPASDVIEVEVTAISANGRRVVCRARIGNGMGGYTDYAVMWTDVTAITLLPLSGITQDYTQTLDAHIHREYRDDNGLKFVTDIDYIPAVPGVAGAPGTPGVIREHDVSYRGDGESTTEAPYYSTLPTYPYSVDTVQTAYTGTDRIGPYSAVLTQKTYTWTAPADMAPTGVTDDGVICGTVRPPKIMTPPTNQAFRWSAADGLQLLGYGEAHDLTDDGETIVGHRTTDSGDEWFLWTAATGVVNGGIGQANGVASAAFEDGTASPLGTLAAGRNFANDDPGRMAVVRTPPDDQGNFTETALGYGRGGVSSVATDITIFTDEFDL